MLYYYLYVKDNFIKRYFTLKTILYKRISKMKKVSMIRSTFFLLFLLPLFLCSCTIVRESTQEPQKLKTALALIEKQENSSTGKGIKKKSREKVSKDSAKILAEYRYGRKLLKAFIENDAKSFVKLLPAQMQKEFDNKKFTLTRKAVTDSMGEPVSYRYVTALEMSAVTPHIWAIRFSRISRDGKEEYTSEMLFRVITGTLDGKPYIIGFNFF